MRRLAALLVLVVVAPGCGGDERTARESSVPGGPSPESVVRGWADDLRSGDVDGATDRFAVPAIVANGTPELRLETRKEIRFFNDSLPCGSRVVATKRHYGLVIATLELTDRPGSRCDGTGHRAKAAFEVRGGKIVRWLRVPMDGESAAPRGEVV